MRKFFIILILSIFILGCENDKKELKELAKKIGKEQKRLDNILSQFNKIKEEQIKYQTKIDIILYILFEDIKKKIENLLIIKPANYKKEIKKLLKKIKKIKELVSKEQKDKINEFIEKYSNYIK